MRSGVSSSRRPAVPTRKVGLGRNSSQLLLRLFSGPTTAVTVKACSLRGLLSGCFRLPLAPAAVFCHSNTSAGPEAVTVGTKLVSVPSRSGILATSHGRPIAGPPSQSPSNRVGLCLLVGVKKCCWWGRSLALASPL